MAGAVLLPKVYDGRNRTFWSFGYEGVKVRRESTFTGTVPTLEQRRGDFSSLLRLGAQHQVYDPFTAVPAANGTFSGTPLAGNVIPASRINPVGAKLLSFSPEPNSPGRLVFGASYVGNRGTKLLVGRQLSPIREQYLSTSPVRNQLLRAYPHFTGVSTNLTSVFARTEYGSLTTELGCSSHSR